VTTSVVVLVGAGAAVVEEPGGLGTGELGLLDVKDEGDVDDVDDVDDSGAVDDADDVGDVDDVVLEVGVHLVQR